MTSFNCFHLLLLMFSASCVSPSNKFDPVATTSQDQLISEQVQDDLVTETSTWKRSSSINSVVDIVSNTLSKEYDPSLPSTEEFHIEMYDENVTLSTDDEPSTELPTTVHSVLNTTPVTNTTTNDTNFEITEDIVKDVKPKPKVQRKKKVQMKVKKKIQKKVQKKVSGPRQNGRKRIKTTNKTKVQKRKKKEKKKKNKPKDKDSNKRVKSKSSTKVRLPSSVTPVHYVLRLHPRFDKFLVTGSVEIEIEVRDSTPRIKLHSSGIAVNKSSVKVNQIKKLKEVPIKNVKFNPARKFMTIKLGRRLKPGRVYVISAKFSYRLNEEPKGFYRITQEDFGGSERYAVAATQFWPAFAREAFPCFDEPGMKATFDVHLARSEGMRALTNMPLVRSYRIKREPKWVWDQFATSPNMSTYHLAFTITDFTSSSTDNRNTTRLKVWSRKGTGPERSLGLEVGTTSLAFFEEFFGLEFPLPKLDMIALPKMAFNGMENWGLVTYRESNFLHDSSSASAEESLAVSLLVAHEIAHQWFGNLVTLQWWGDLWLNEGFATYMSYVAVNQVKPLWNALSYFVVTRQQEVMARDSLLSTHPVSTPVKDPARIHEVFDSIPYNKGASLIRMMKHFLSESTFREGIKQYLRKFKFTNTRQDDLWDSLSGASRRDQSLPIGVSVKEIMDTWTLQKGYPVLNVQRFNNGTALLTQKRFLLRNTKSAAKGPSKWWIPITFTTQERPSFRHTRAQTWLRQEDDSLQVTGLPARDKWVVFNLQQTGFYRVNYDEETWLLLIEQLHSQLELIHVTNRAQLIDDSMNLARAGMLRYDLALELISYMKEEEMLTPWKAGFRNLKYLKKMLQLSSNYGLFKNFVMDLMSPLARKIGFTPKYNDSLEERLLRSELVSWLCQMEDSACSYEARKLHDSIIKTNFTQWNKLLPNSELSDPVFCLVVKQSNEEFWERLWNVYRRTELIDEKRIFLRALGCTNYVWLMNRYLSSVADPEAGIMRQEATQMYRAATRAPVGVYVAWDSFRRTWNHLKKFSDYVLFVASGVIDEITGSFNTLHQLDSLRSFKEDVKDDSKSETKVIRAILPALNSAIAQVEANVKWMTKNQKSIFTWLSKQGYTHQILS